MKFYGCVAKSFGGPNSGAMWASPPTSGEIPDYSYLELPVSLRTTIDYNNTAFFFKIGYYLDINIWKNSVQKSGCTVGHWIGPYFYRPFDHGIQGGVGVELNEKISIQSRLYYGLYNITNFYNSNEFYSNYVINLSVGYKFKKKPNDKQCSK